MLQYPDEVIGACTTEKPTDSIPFLHEDEPHDCETQVTEYAKWRSDLSVEPLACVDYILFINGSCYRESERLEAGYAVVQMHESRVPIAILVEPCFQQWSVRSVELLTLTETWKLAQGKIGAIFTDSAIPMGCVRCLDPSGKTGIYTNVQKCSGPQPFLRHGPVSCKTYFHGPAGTDWEER